MLRFPQCAIPPPRAPAPILEENMSRACCRSAAPLCAPYMHIHGPKWGSFRTTAHKSQDNTLSVSSAYSDRCLLRLRLKCGCFAYHLPQDPPAPERPDRGCPWRKANLSDRRARAGNAPAMVSEVKRFSIPPKPTTAQGNPQRNANALLSLGLLKSSAGGWTPSSTSLCRAARQASARSCCECVS